MHLNLQCLTAKFSVCFEISETSREIAVARYSPEHERCVLLAFEGDIFYKSFQLVNHREKSKVRKRI